jgi:hypothetical protein
MTENRIHFAPEPDTVTAPDIAQAIRDLQEINNEERRWATMRCDIDASHRIVKVDWGIIHSNGDRECAIQTISYTLLKDGTVHVTKYTHP